MDYTSSADFDNNPFASDDGFGHPSPDQISAPRPMFSGDGGFDDHRRLPHSPAVAGLFGGEDNSPAGGLFSEDDAHQPAVQVARGGFGAGSEHEEEDESRREQQQQQQQQQQQHATHQPGPEHEHEHQHEHEHEHEHAPPPPKSPQPQQHREQPHHHRPEQQHQQQRRQGPGAGPAGSQPQQQQRQVQQYRLQAKVTALERLGRKDPVIRFDVHTNLPRFRTTQFRDVRRTHPEFTKLAEHLISNNPECFVPADDARVRGLMQRWLNYVCGNEVLMRDEEMILFIESDSGYSPVVRKKQPATGVRRRVIKQFAPPPDDTPELADARPIVKAFYLGTMETAHKVDKVVKTRRGLGLAESDLGVKLHNLSTHEPHAGMSNALRKLGKTIQQVGDYHAAQATAEATTLGDPLQYHSSDAFIVKETLTNRQIIQRELQQAQANTRSKESTAKRLQAGSNIKKDKSDEALEALQEARHMEDVLTQKFTRVTSNLVQERRRWFYRTSMDLRASIRDYVLRQIEAERRLLSTLESVRPDIRAIDASGGLSRLGRDAPPSARRASVAASQGPRGDAWSGAPRSGASMRSSGLIVPGLDGGVSPVNGGEVAGRKVPGGLPGIEEVPGVGAVGVAGDEEDRLDAKNAASRLATSTF
ncbi:Vps5 C terminal like-domain-containing protein [Kalaharituber pfeilii]|nr:Vps5 C terminal like-domain-containing protein [Kalaharituber pfeilii]